MKSVAELMNLQSRTALVAGGAGHIGKAVAAALAELGAHVTLLDLPGPGLTTAARDLDAVFPNRISSLGVDLADAEQVRSVPTGFRQLDIIVNSAAMVGTSDLQNWAVPFEQQGLDAWNKAMTVNLTGPFFLIQACTPLLRKSGHASVINISSIYGMVGPDMRIYGNSGLGNPAGYAASKGALLQITRWLSTVLAPQIRVNAISPGGVWRNQAQDFLAAYCTRTPLGRMATEEDLKGAIAYLASDLSAYVTGQNLAVDGGWTAW